MFKLYLTGIETRNERSVTGTNKMFKLYLTGIETDNEDKKNGNENGFKLYLTGIETGVNVRDMRALTEFKLYLTGIETSSKYQRKRFTFRSNCTLLELKQWCKRLTDWQRTFKLYLTGIETIPNWFRSCKTEIVQIVPYWNWNRSSSAIFRCRSSSNCTLLELKQVMTFRMMRLSHSSNCTLLELKLMYGSGASAGSGVQIVPYWNWNLCR